MFFGGKLAAEELARDDVPVSRDVLGRLLFWGLWSGASVRTVVRYLSEHSGVPALLIGTLLVVVGWRILRKTLRFVVEIALVTAALIAMTQLGWIRW